MMPLFEYQCRDCDSLLEIFQHDVDHHPKRCGFRCPLEAQSNQECRGLGELVRRVSTVNSIAKRTQDYRKPSVEEAGKAGFTVYENKGGGKIKKIAGKQGPKSIKIND